MATIVLDVQDESLLPQIKRACQLLKGVASVKVVSKREKSQACLNSSEREQAQAELKVHKTKNEDIPKRLDTRRPWTILSMAECIMLRVWMTCLSRFWADV